MKIRQRKRSWMLPAAAAGALLSVRLPLPPIIVFGIFVAVMLGFIVSWTMFSEQASEEIPEEEVVQCPWCGYRTRVGGRQQVLCVRCGLASWDRADRVADR